MFFFCIFSENMRNYQRKSERAKTPKNIIRNAVDAVLINGRSIRQTATDFNIPSRSLTRYVKIMKNEVQPNDGVHKSPIPSNIGYTTHRQASLTMFIYYKLSFNLQFCLYVAVKSSHSIFAHFLLT